MRRNIGRYIELKENIKKMTEEKKQLESKICKVMEDNGMSTLDLGNGTNLNYMIKESLNIGKKKSGN